MKGRQIRKQWKEKEGKKNKEKKSKRKKTNEGEKWVKENWRQKGREEGIEYKDIHEKKMGKKETENTWFIQ